MQLKNRWEKWRDARHPPVVGTVTVANNRVYIVPSKAGAGFAIVLVALLTGSINYNNSLGYSLTFLLASTYLSGMIYCYRNIAGISWQVSAAKSVFVGDEARFPVTVSTNDRLVRVALGLAGPINHVYYHDISQQRPATEILAQPTTRRGTIKPPRAKLFTEFPLGLFHAWTFITGNSESIVYPLPETATQKRAEMRSMEAGNRPDVGDNDFHGLRRYQQGESIKHVAWKVYAREQGLFTKVFAGAAPMQHWIDWDQTAGLDTESRLSRLCRWILDAHGHNEIYGLKIPGTTISPAKGDAHLHQCLRALALFPVGGKSA